jgi:hypothetical protein
MFMSTSTSTSTPATLDQQTRCRQAAAAAAAGAAVVLRHVSESSHRATKRTDYALDPEVGYTKHTRTPVACVAACADDAGNNSMPRSMLKMQHCGAALPMGSRRTESAGGGWGGERRATGANQHPSRLGPPAAMNHVRTVAAESTSQCR